MAEEMNQHSNSTALVGEKPDEPFISSEDLETLSVMVKAGVLFGRRSSKTNPRMSPFIEMTRNGVEMFNYAKTLSALDAAGDFLEQLARERGMLLCVGTTPSAKELIKAFADASHYPRVTERWLGGTLTNFQTIGKRLEYYLKLKADHEGGRLERYTKKERTGFAKEIEKLARFFTGLEGLKTTPQALFVIGVNAHMTAVREANRLQIPIVAVANTDANPDLIQYVIPANDGARSSLIWILERLQKRIQAGQAAANIAPQAQPEGRVEHHDKQ